MSHDLRAEINGSIHDIAPDHWNACAGTGNPFVRHGFLAALEQSRAAAGETGWLPRHVTLRDERGEIVAAAPLYVKSHSYGEYVFDWGWAEAYSRAGGRYYPKLQCAVPFTPATGPRLLVRDDTPEIRLALAQALIRIAQGAGVSSLHVTFPTKAESELMAQAGMLTRLGCQYHWENQDYASFDDFLGQLASRKRKQIKKERQAVRDQGFRFTALVGAEITARHWDVFYGFYEAVIDRKWGSAYLTRDFFDHLSASEVGDKVVLVWAERDGHPMAGAFNVLGADTLFGRNWGCQPGLDAPFLHFETCYYQALDFAIAHKVARVEAGAQGEHKVARGYLPSPTYSAHWIADPALRAAVARFLEQEEHALRQDMEIIATEGPFRADFVPSKSALPLA